jgi:hypothetical protein
MEENKAKIPQWMRGFLLLASIYNIAWGIFIYNFPTAYYGWLTKTNLEAPAIISYQGLGTIAFGAIYFLTACYPLKLWFLILLGILSKLTGAIGIYYIIMDQQMTRTFIFQMLMNDLIWIVPFILIFFKVMEVRKFREGIRAD